MALAADDPIFTAIANMKERIREVTASPNPDYTVGNRSISKAAYLTTLRQELLELTRTAQDLDGPYMIDQRVYSY